MKNTYNSGDKIIITNSWEPQNYSNGEKFTVLERINLVPNRETYSCEHESGKYEQFLDIGEIELYIEEEDQNGSVN